MQVPFNGKATFCSQHSQTNEKRLAALKCKCTFFSGRKRKKDECELQHTEHPDSAKG